MRGKLSGIDIVPEVARLATMNLYLHGITHVETMIEQKDALLNAGDRVYDVILTNPPFGKKQSYRIVRGAARSRPNARITIAPTSSSPRRTSSSTSSSTS